MQGVSPWATVKFSMLTYERSSLFIITWAGTSLAAALQLKRLLRVYEAGLLFIHFYLHGVEQRQTRSLCVLHHGLLHLEFARPCHPVGADEAPTS